MLSHAHPIVVIACSRTTTERKKKARKVFIYAPFFSKEASGFGEKKVLHQTGKTKRYKGNVFPVERIHMYVCIYFYVCCWDAFHVTFQIRKYFLFMRKEGSSRINVLTSINGFFFVVLVYIDHPR